MSRTRHLLFAKARALQSLRSLVTSSFTLLRCLHCLILATIISTFGGCMCQIGAPPLHFSPLHFEEHFAADSQDCQGDVDHGHWDLQWHWDRCALPGSIIWTALYFAHRRNSELEVGKSICTHDLLPYSDLSNCRNSFDAKKLFHLAQNKAHILLSRGLEANRCSSPECQPPYTPFIAEHPCLLSTHSLQPLTDGSLSLLPPMTLSVYIQNGNDESLSKWSWWRPALNFSLSLLNCAEDSAPYHDWYLFTRSFSDTFRCCEGCPHNHFPSNFIRLHANTEYLLDNIFLDTFTLKQFSQIDSVPCSPFRISVSASLMPGESWSRDEFPNDAVASQPITWRHQFHASTERVSKVPSSKLVRRRSAKVISHKLCQTAASYPKSGSFQTYDAGLQTVSTSFSFENGRTVSIVALAASVKHTENGRALFEVLVWTEFDQSCGTDDTLIHHCVGQKLDLAAICDVAGTTAPGIITQDIVANGHREAVISCEFSSNLLKRSSGEVLVSLSDSMKGFKLMLPMCPLDQNFPVRKLVACSQPIYNANFLEKRWPGVLQAWVLYHINYMGFDHFTLYDSDGSAAPFVAPLLQQNISFAYFPNWAVTPCAATAAQNLPYCSQTMVENHCMWNARGSAEWVMLISAPDCFVNDSPGAPLLLELLDSLEHRVSALLLPTFVFENPNNNSFIHASAPEIFTAFTKRRCPMLLSSRHMPIFDPHDVAVAFVHEELTKAAGTTRQYTASLAVHHYFQLFSSRGSDDLKWSTYTGMAVPYCEDRSMVHAGNVVRELLKQINGT